MSDMETRLARAEWRLDAVEEAQQRQYEQMIEMGGRMEAHHREVMEAIGSLKDDRARQRGAAEARLADAQRTRDRMKAASLVLGIIALLATLGWINTSDAAVIVPTQPAEPPIPVQNVEDILP